MLHKMMNKATSHSDDKKKEDLCENHLSRLN